MDVEIYPVKLFGKGRLYIMPCPKAAQLAHNLNQLRDLGISKIISLLEVSEAERLGVAHEAALCERVGIAFQQFPIRDHKTPSDPVKFRQLIDTLEQELRDGGHIAIHCYAGIGRTGLVASALLMNDGLAMAAATDFLSDIRGCAVPQTHEQSNYLLDYEAGDETEILPPARQKNWFTRWLSPA